jgi:hypothetical protein
LIIHFSPRPAFRGSCYAHCFGALSKLSQINVK